MGRLYEQDERSTPHTQPRRHVARGNARVPVVSVMVGVLIVAAATGVYLKQDMIRGLLGPPAVAMADNYPDRPDGPTFDHSAFDRLLKKHVAPGGWVDYQGLSGDAAALDRYIGALALAPASEMGRDERLALLINAYNAFTLRLILDYYPLKSIKDIPSGKRWEAKRWRIGPHTLSLNQIEHERIRPNFKEPRIHFALVCAAVGCPPLRNEVYVADRLEAQLDSQSRYVHHHDRWLRFDPQRREDVYLTRLYKWYGGDFEQAGGSVQDFAARYAPALRRVLDDGGRPRTHWLDYDWSLNSRENAP